MIFKYIKKNQAYYFLFQWSSLNFHSALECIFFFSTESVAINPLFLQSWFSGHPSESYQSQTLGLFAKEKYFNLKTYCPLDCNLQKEVQP